ncbi:MAG: hypothetical protein ACRCZI_10065 [Cetobacterium sp.]
MDDGRACNSDLNHPSWIVRAEGGDRDIFDLPKSEYVPVDERDESWIDVTSDLSVRDLEFASHMRGDYRLRQIRPAAATTSYVFIVERRRLAKPPKE